jgi:hypothetical protein
MVGGRSMVQMSNFYLRDYGVLKYFHSSWNFRPWSPVGYTAGENSIFLFPTTARSADEADLHQLLRPRRLGYCLACLVSRNLAVPLVHYPLSFLRLRTLLFGTLSFAYNVFPVAAWAPSRGSGLTNRKLPLHPGGPSPKVWPPCSFSNKEPSKTTVWLPCPGTKEATSKTCRREQPQPSREPPQRGFLLCACLSS